jgi:plastocyanin
MVCVSTVCLALLGEQGTSVVAQRVYREVSVRDGGTIQGVVRLAGTIPRLATMPVAKDRELCSVNKSSPRLIVGASRGVQYAVVSLEGIRSGKKFDTATRPTLDQRACIYEPHVVILPMGATLEIVNSDPILHNVHAYSLQNNLTTVFNIAQPVRGQRTPLPSSTFDGPGFYRATCDAGHPWMSAYIVVTEHPYYAVTDEEGRYMLENVPPGRYRISMWHEGVHITRTEMEKGAVKMYTYEAPYEAKKDVEVMSKGTVTVDFEFEVRKRL